MICKFCEDYKELRELSEEKQARRKSKFVAVLREDIEKGGCVSYGSYDLNYCPNCGARLEEKRVRCIDCDHLGARDVQWQAGPVCVCQAKIWDGMHMAPHLIGHDPCLPILCDHFEKKGGTDR